MIDHQYNQPYGSYGYQPGYAQYGWMPPSPEIAERRAVRKNSTIMGISIILFFVASEISGIVIYFIAMALFPDSYNSYGFNFNEVQTQVLNMIQYVGIMAIPFVFCLIFIRIPIRAALPFKKAPTEITALAVPVMLALTVVSSLAITLLSSLTSIFGVVPTMPEISLPTSLPAQILFVIYIAVLPAILEEFLFRGVIMQSLRRFSDTFAIIVSSVLFGLIHGNLIQAPNAFLLGLCIGYFVVRTNNILTGIVLHFLNNFISIILEYAMLDLSDYSQVVFIYILYAGYILLGVIALIILSKRYPDMFSLKKKTTELSSKQQVRTFFTSPAMVIAVLIICSITSLYFVPIS